MKLHTTREAQNEIIRKKHPREMTTDQSGFKW